MIFRAEFRSSIVVLERNLPRGDLHLRAIGSNVAHASIRAESLATYRLLRLVSTNPADGKFPALSLCFSGEGRSTADVGGLLALPAAPSQSNGTAVARTNSSYRRRQTQQTPKRANVWPYLNRRDMRFLRSRSRPIIPGTGRCGCSLMARTGRLSWRHSLYPAANTSAWTRLLQRCASQGGLAAGA